MPLLIRLPRNERVLSETGSYPSGLNILSRKETAVQRQLRRGGLASYEPATQATLLALVQLAPRPTTFFDIGAHIGLYSAMMATIFPPALVKVTAFEPTPATALIARRVAHFNGLSITVEETALSSVSGTGRLYISAKAETSNSLKEGFRVATTVVDVPMTTLDDYCLKHDVSPGVIKIDVETFESHVLRGGLATFQAHRPWLVCELLASGDPESTTAVLLEFESIGYTLHRFEAGGSWVPTSSRTYRDHLSPEHRDWLLAPSELPDDFAAVLQKWLTAIAACDKETNILVPAGQRPPDGWDRPFCSEAPAGNRPDQDHTAIISPRDGATIVPRRLTTASERKTRRQRMRRIAVARRALDRGGMPELVRAVRKSLAARVYPGRPPQPARRGPTSKKVPEASTAAIAAPSALAAPSAETGHSRPLTSR
ncbi:MAG: FkbM family methyltransferase [Actinobacteria bacterium]|nr:FkbM family methyltransferase [Actinomycetota bacterium]